VHNAMLCYVRAVSKAEREDLWLKARTYIEQINDGSLNTATIEHYVALLLLYRDNVGDSPETINTYFSFLGLLKFYTVDGLRHLFARPWSKRRDKFIMAANPPELSWVFPLSDVLVTPAGCSLLLDPHKRYSALTASLQVSLRALVARKFEAAFLLGDAVTELDLSETISVSTVDERLNRILIRGWNKIVSWGFPEAALPVPEVRTVTVPKKKLSFHSSGSAKLDLLGITKEASLAYDRMRSQQEMAFRLTVSNAADRRSPLLIPVALEPEPRPRRAHPPRPLVANQVSHTFPAPTLDHSRTKTQLSQTG